MGSIATEKVLALIRSDLLDAKLIMRNTINKDQTQVRFHQGYLLGKIQRIDAIQHKGTVYNLEVEDDHSYIANGHVVHNCVIALALAWQGVMSVNLPMYAQMTVKERTTPY